MADLEKTIQIDVKTNVEDAGGTKANATLNRYASTVEKIQQRLNTLKQLQKQIFSGESINPKAVKELNEEYDALQGTLKKVQQAQDALSGANLDDSLKLIDNISQATEETAKLQEKLERSSEYAKGMGKISASAPNPFDSGSVKATVVKGADSVGKQMGSNILSGLDSVLPSGLTSSFKSALSSGSLKGGIATAALNLAVTGVKYFTKETSNTSKTMAEGLKSAMSHAAQSALSGTEAVVRRGIGSLNNAVMTGVRGIASKLTSAIEPSLNRIKSLIATIGGTFLRIPFIPRLNNISLGLRGITGKLLALGGAGGLGFLIKKAGDLASETQGISQSFNTVFSDANDSVHNFVANASQSFGLAEEDAKSLATSFGETFASANIASDKIQTMTQNMVGLSGDMASLYNVSATEMGNKLQSAVQGSSDALRELGITMSDAQLESFRLAQGIQTSYSNMSQADKEILRYNYILQQTTKAQGAATAQTQSWNASLRSIAVSLRTIASTIANSFMNMLAPVLAVISKVLSGIASVVKVLGGKVSFKPAATKSIGNAADSYTGLGKAADAAADSVDKVGKSSKKAAKEQKKQNKQTKLGLAAFDQLNNLTKEKNDEDKKSKDNMPSSSGKTGGAGGLGGIGNIDPMDYVSGIDWGKNKKLEKWLEGLKKLLNKKEYREAGQYIAEGFRNALKGIDKWATDPKTYKAISDWADKWSKLVGGFVGDMKLWRDLGKTVGDVMNLISSAVNTTIDKFTKQGVFKNTGKGLATALNNTMKAVDWKQWGEGVGKIIRAGLDTVAAFVANFDWKLAGQSMLTSLLGTLDAVFGENALGEKGTETIGHGLADIINGGFTYIGEVLKGGELARTLGEDLTETLNVAIHDLDPSALQSALEGMLDSIAGFFDEAKNTDFLTLATKVADGINGALSATVEDQSKVSRAIESILQFFKNAIAGVVQGLSTIDFTKLGLEIADGINRAVADQSEGAKTQEMITSLFGLILNAVKGLATAVANINWSEVAIKLANGLNENIKNGNVESTAKAIADALVSAVQGVSTFLANLDVKGLVEALVSGINEGIAHGNVKKTAENLLTFLTNAVEAVITGIAEIDWVSLANQIVQSINGAIEEFDPTTLGNALATIIRKATGVIQELNNIDFTQLVTKMLNVLKIAIDKGDLTELIESINALIRHVTAALVKFIRSPEGKKLIEGWIEIAGELTKAKLQLFFAALPAIIEGHAKNIVGLVGTVLTNFVKLVLNGLLLPAKVLEWLIGLQVKLIENIATWIAGLVKKIIPVIANGFVSFWKTLGDNLVKAVKGIAKGLENFADGVNTYIIKPVKEIWGKIKDSWNDLKSNIGNVIDTIGDKFSDLKDWFSNRVTKPLGKVWSAIKNAWDSFKTNITDRITTVKTKFDEFKTKLNDFVIGPAKKIWSSIADKWNAFKTNITNIINAVLKPFKDFKKVIDDVIEKLKGIPGAIRDAVSNVPLIGNLVNKVDKASSGKASKAKVARAKAAPAWSSWGDEEEDGTSTVSTASAKPMFAPRMMMAMRAPVAAASTNALSTTSASTLSSTSSGSGNMLSSMNSSISTLADIATVTSKSFSSMQKNVDVTVDDTIVSLKELYDALSKYITEPMSKVWEKVSQGWSDFKLNISEACETINGALGNIKKGIEDNIITPMTTMWNEVSGSWGSFEDSINSATSLVVTSLKKVKTEVSNLSTKLKALTKTANNTVKALRDLASAQGKASSGAKKSDSSKDKGTSTTSKTKDTNKKGTSTKAQAKEWGKAVAEGYEDVWKRTKDSLDKYQKLAEKYTASISTATDLDSIKEYTDKLNDVEDKIDKLQNNYAVAAREFNNEAKSNSTANKYFEAAVKDLQKQGSLTDLSKSFEDTTKQLRNVTTAITESGVYNISSSQIIHDLSAQQGSSLANGHMTVNLNLEGRVLDSYIIDTIHNSVVRNH